MQKYLQLFKISITSEFVYRINFIMWRMRNVLQVILIFYLWDTIFSSPGKEIFGYDRAKILTYIFGLILVRSVVLSMRSVDIAGDIARGDLANLLLKPVSYLKFWYTRDLSSKALNLFFAIIEAMVLYFLIRPEFFFQTNFLYLILFLMSVVFAVILYFLLVFLFSMPPFWFPQQAWGFIFLLLVFTDLLGGGIFPVDILPEYIQKWVLMTPFPHLLFVPVGIYLGKFSFSETFRLLITAGIWISILVFLNNKLWKLGLKTFRAEGR